MANEDGLMILTARSSPEVATISGMMRLDREDVTGHMRINVVGHANNAAVFASGYMIANFETANGLMKVDVEL